MLFHPVLFHNVPPARQIGSVQLRNNTNWTAAQRFQTNGVPFENSPAGSGTAALRLILPHRGMVRAVQQNRRLIVLPGQCGAIRLDRMFTMEDDPPGADSVGAVVPFHQLRLWGIEPTALAGRSWTLSPAGLAAYDLLTSAVDRELTAASARESHVADLFLRAMQVIIDDAAMTVQSPESPAAAVRRRALEVIEARYVDPSLTPSAIADELFVSIRTLFRAFEGVPTTVAQLLRQKRLNEAAARLEIDGSAQTITAIARACGFGNLDHFTRSFRAAYAMTPAEFRRRHRDDQSAAVSA